MWTKRDGKKQTPLPEWAVARHGWRYVGWISRKTVYATFEEFCERAVVSDHGETREIDLYPEGATVWVREPLPGGDL